MIKEITIVVITSSILAVAAYVLVVKENKINIIHIKKELKEMKDIAKKNEDSLVATKLFIAQAHPDRDASNLASLIKLQKFNRAEIVALAQSLPDVKLGPGPNKEIVKLPVSLKELVKKYQLTGNDFANFTAVANTEAFVHNM